MPIPGNPPSLFNAADGCAVRAPVYDGDRRVCASRAAASSCPGRGDARKPVSSRSTSVAPVASVVRHDHDRFTGVDSGAVDALAEESRC